MGIATVFVIPSKIEPLFWLIIFIICAIIIAKKCTEKYFLHGFLTSLMNSVWITASHILLYNTYISRHADEAMMMSSMPMATHPRLMMLITGPIIGIISGLVLGLFALIAHKLIKKS